MPLTPPIGVAAIAAAIPGELACTTDQPRT